jgi:hypothetical protein
VIARTWRGSTNAADAERYATYIEETGLREYRATPGNLGAWLLYRVEGDVAHFLAISLWESIEAVKAFAGDQVGRAVFYPEDDDMLLTRDVHADHWSVREARVHDVAGG